MKDKPEIKPGCFNISSVLVRDLKNKPEITNGVVVLVDCKSDENKILKNNLTKDGIPIIVLSNIEKYQDAYDSIAKLWVAVGEGKSVYIPANLAERQLPVALVDTESGKFKLADYGVLPKGLGEWYWAQLNEITRFLAMEELAKNKYLEETLKNGDTVCQQFYAAYQNGKKLSISSKVAEHLTPAKIKQIEDSYNEERDDGYVAKKITDHKSSEVYFKILDANKNHSHTIHHNGTIEAAKKENDGIVYEKMIRDAMALNPLGTEFIVNHAGKEKIKFEEALEKVSGAKDKFKFSSDEKAEKETEALDKEIENEITAIFSGSSELFEIKKGNYSSITGLDASKDGYVIKPKGDTKWGFSPEEAKGKELHNKILKCLQDKYNTKGATGDSQAVKSGDIGARIDLTADGYEKINREYGQVKTFSSR